MGAAARLEEGEMRDGGGGMRGGVGGGIRLVGFGWRGGIYIIGLSNLHRPILARSTVPAFMLMVG
jgi:hypothetical protein